VVQHVISNTILRLSIGDCGSAILLSRDMDYLTFGSKGRNNCAVAGFPEFFDLPPTLEIFYYFRTIRCTRRKDVLTWEIFIIKSVDHRVSSDLNPP
jgi:hypothetical protein